MKKEKDLFEGFYDRFGLDLKEDIKIDLLNLHLEWIKQPQLYMEYARLNADIKRGRDLLMATINNQIRKNMLEKTGKIVEATVKAELISNRDLIQADHDVSMTAAALKAIDMRKYALENEVKLFLGEYFSIPKDSNIIKNEKIKEKIENEKSKNVFVSKKRKGN